MASGELFIEYRQKPNGEPCDSFFHQLKSFSVEDHSKGHIAMEYVTDSGKIRMDFRKEGICVCVLDSEDKAIDGCLLAACESDKEKLQAWIDEMVT